MVTLNTNVQSLNAQRLVNINNANLGRTAQRLSSGLRINSASDDPSGLAIAESLTSQIRGDKVASDQNIQQAQSMIQVADSGLSQIGDILQRMRELSVQANNTGLTAAESNALDAEYQSLQTAIDNIATGASFNGFHLLDNTGNGAVQTVTVQTGWDQTSTMALAFNNDYQAAGVQVNLAGTDLTSAANAQAAQTAIDTAITNVATGRSDLGAQSSSLSALKGALDASVVATTDARSHITDADVANEVSNLVRQQLLQQAGASALSSANFNAQFIVKLLT
jgi:flagellin